MVIGTAAVEEPSLVEDLCRKYGNQRVIVAVDAKNGLVAIKGWLEMTDVNAQDLVERMALLGVRRILYTDISRDGTLTEPNFQANADLVRTTDMAVFGSRGVTTPGHIPRFGEDGGGGANPWRALFTPKKSFTGGN